MVLGEFNVNVQTELLVDSVDVNRNVQPPEGHADSAVMLNVAVPVLVEMVLLKRSLPEHVPPVLM